MRERDRGRWSISLSFSLSLYHWMERDRNSRLPWFFSLTFINYFNKWIAQSILYVLGVSKHGHKLRSHIRKVKISNRVQVMITDANKCTRMHENWYKIDDRRYRKERARGVIQNQTTDDFELIGFRIFQSRKRIKSNPLWFSSIRFEFELIRTPLI